jgi:hypothetical protein
VVALHLFGSERFLFRILNGATVVPLEPEREGQGIECRSISERKEKRASRSDYDGAPKVTTTFNASGICAAAKASLTLCSGN